MKYLRNDRLSFRALVLFVGMAFLLIFPYSVSCDDGQARSVNSFNGSSTGQIFPGSVTADKSDNDHVAGYNQTQDVTIPAAWVQRYSGPAGGENSPTGVAVDKDGAAYVTGFSFTTEVTLTASYDFATIKYNKSGKEQWAKRYSGPAGGQNTPVGIVVDGSGNSYITGYSFTTEYTLTGTYDYATVKYDPNGNQKWAKRFSGPKPSSYDSPAGIGVDGSGSAYVTGSTVGASTGWDYTTLKYNTDGTQAWVQYYNGPGKEDDRPNATKVDQSGNVYVTGYACTGSVTDTVQYDYTTIKYDKNGKPVWPSPSRYSGPSPGYNTANAIAVDGSSNVYVTGSSKGAGQYEYNFATVKYDKCGKQKLESRYAAAKQRGRSGRNKADSFDEATSIAVDGSGNVYVAGKCGDSSYTGTKLHG